MIRQRARVAVGAALVAVASVLVAPAHPAGADDAQTLGCPDPNVNFLIQFTRGSTRAHITRWTGSVAGPGIPSATLYSESNGTAYSITWHDVQSVPEGSVIYGEGSAYADYGSTITMFVTYGDVPLFLCQTTIK